MYFLLKTVGSKDGAIRDPFSDLKHTTLATRLLNNNLFRVQALNRNGYNLSLLNRLMGQKEGGRVSIGRGKSEAQTGAGTSRSIRILR